MDTFQKILRKKKLQEFIFLESSETYKKNVLKIGVKPYFFSKVFIEKSQKLKIKILLHEKIKKNQKIVFESGQKFNLATFEKRGGGLHVVL